MFKFDESMIGKKVKFVGAKFHEDYPEWAPPVGTIGEIILDEYKEDWKVQWAKGTTSLDDCWYCNEEDVELVEEENVTNEEIWQMLEPKMEKNGLLPYSQELYAGSIGIVKNYYRAEDVQNAIAIAYRSGYERCMKGRPFKFANMKGGKN